jgi:hypothetical protein
MPVEAIDELPGVLGDLEQLGLRAWLILSIFALARRWVITRATYDEERADDAERLAYIEARRVEEREGRIAAEKRVSELTERWDRALALMGNIEREIIRAFSRGREQ